MSIKTYSQARAAEELNALMAYLPYARPLFGILVVPLRWEHELELMLAGSPFFTGKAPLRGDFADFLWRLSPFFCAGDGSFPNLRPGASRPSWLMTMFVQWRIGYLCARLDVHAAEPLVREWLAIQRQDAPARSSSAAGDEGGSSGLVETANQFDMVALHFSRECGYTPRQCLELGVAWTWQQMRASDLSSGDEKRRNRWIRPSAELISFSER